MESFSSFFLRAKMWESTGGGVGGFLQEVIYKLDKDR